MYLIEIALAASALFVATAAIFGAKRALKYRDLRGLHGEVPGAIHRHPWLMPSRLAIPSFRQRLATMTNVLPSERFQEIRAQIERLGTTERSYVPTHKKGGTVAYETLCAEAPRVVALYQSSEFRALISNIVGEKVVPTPLHDQSSCSVLFYERPGDHIGWHYDHNFYRGRHFTVLLPIVNRSADASALSAARLVARLDGEEVPIATPPNSLVVFEGACVQHKATPIGENERRIVLSMTFATDPTNSVVQGIARRVKDTAFFGIRALWT